MLSNISYVLLYFLFVLNLFEVCCAEQQPAIVIIGAGAAGIASATKLLKNNFTNIKILEAENCIGGRIRSVKFGDALIDLGAEFCHGEEGNIVHSLVKDLGVLRHREAPARVIESNNKSLPGDQLINFAHSLEIDTDVCVHERSLGECLDKRFDSEIQLDTSKHIKRWITNYLSLYDCPLDLHDLARESNYKKCEGDLWQNWNGHGYKTILDVMMQKFPNPNEQLSIDDKIFLNKEVISIKNWKLDDQIQILTNDGDKFLADHVVFTPSLGVLKENHKQMFSPNLPPEKIETIENLGFGVIGKIISRFEEDIKINEYLGVVWTNEDLKEIEDKKLDWLKTLLGVVRANNNPKVLIAWYTGPNVTSIENLTPIQVFLGQKFLVDKFLRVRYNVSEPKEIIRSSWYTNPHFRGVISYESVKSQEVKKVNSSQEILAKELVNTNEKPTILFAGEATHSYYFSTVHGAIETGYREANKIIQYYRNVNKSRN